MYYTIETFHSRYNGSKI